jgi:hypothetical protein
VKEYRWIGEYASEQDKSKISMTLGERRETRPAQWVDDQ